MSKASLVWSNRDQAGSKNKTGANAYRWTPGRGKPKKSGTTRCIGLSRHVREPCAKWPKNGPQRRSDAETRVGRRRDVAAEADRVGRVEQEPSSSERASSCE